MWFRAAKPYMACHKLVMHKSSAEMVKIMDNCKHETFIGYLDRQTADIQKTIALLVADERKDESDFEKIRANIFQIAKSVYQTSLKTFPEENARLEFLDSRLAMIAQSWKSALDKAKTHHDEVRVLQEQLKLDTMEEILKKRKEIWEVAE